MDLLEALGISPPAADSAVCYEVYDTSSANGSSDVHLDAFKVGCMQLLLRHLEGYIWQREPFRLQSSLKQLPPWMVKKRGKSQQQQEPLQEVPCLWGVVRYEDNVEDEWFVVWLLLQLTAQIPGVCVRVWDDDGDFMLIEAAYSLPRWLKPETATNRVWLYQGQLHIIPPPSAKAPTLPAQPTIREALQILSSGQVNTHRPKVEAAVLSRVSGYPGKAVSNRQRVMTWLPRRIGRVLQEDPQLIAAATAAFMTRTREDVQAAVKMHIFPAQDMTTTLVTMNRCQYAQLMQADFTPPKAYPQPAQQWLGDNEDKQAKAVNMGAKIHTGFEIMCLRMGLTGGSHSSGGSNTVNQGGAADLPAQPPDADATSQQQQQQLPNNPAWHHYLTVLKQSGYFAGELEGSARYKQLLAAAAAAFTDSAAHLHSSEALAAPSHHMQQLLQMIDQQQGQQQHGNGVASASAAAVLDAEGLSEDSDSWIESEAAAVQQQLAAAEAQIAAQEARKQQRTSATAAAGAGGHDSHSTPQQQTGSSNRGDAVVVDADQLVAGFRGFVDHDAAGPEGAEVPVSNAAAAARSSSAAGVDLNPDAFLSELMGVLGAAAPAGGSSEPQQQQQQQRQRSNAKQRQQDPDALLSQLQSLQQQLMRVLGDSSQQAGAAGGELQGGLPGFVDESDENETSSSEGSSFYGSDSGDEDGPSSEGQQTDHMAAPAQLPVAPPVSGTRKQQQQHGPAGDGLQKQQQQWQLPPSFRGADLQEAWEVQTATDSDDSDNLSLGGSDDTGGTDSDSESSTEQFERKQQPAQLSERDRHRGGAAEKRERSHEFYDAYDALLQSELAGTTLAQSFERLPVPTAAASAMGEGTAAAAAGAGASGSGLAPLDVDMNLIKSLVASYTAQGGLPGPASNLAGLLGLQLPTEVVEEK